VSAFQRSERGQCFLLGLLDAEDETTWLDHNVGSYFPVDRVFKSRKLGSLSPTM